MPKFLKVGEYQPEDYTKAEYMQYRYLRDRARGEGASAAILRPQGISSIKRGSQFSKENLIRFHMEELALCRSSSTFQKSGDNLREYISNLGDKFRKEGEQSLLLLLERNIEENFLGEDLGELFRAKRQAFVEALRFVCSVEVDGDSRDPDELSPINKSLSHLKFAAALWQSEAMPTDIANAHAANLALVNDPKFEGYCEVEFLDNGSIEEAKLAITPPTSPENAGFLLKVYRSPAFQHWLTQLLLLAVVLTAALVIAAFTVNATLLPLAVAGVVKGFSGMAAKAVLGSAIVIGTGFTVALSASLHARFFAARDEAGAAPPAGVSTNSAHI